MTQAPGLFRPMLRSARFFHVFVSGLYLSTVLWKRTPHPPKPKHLYKRTVSATGNKGSPENQIESKSTKSTNIVFFTEIRKFEIETMRGNFVRSHVLRRNYGTKLAMNVSTSINICKKKSSGTTNQATMMKPWRSWRHHLKSQANPTKTNTKVQPSVIDSNQVREIST